MVFKAAEVWQGPEVVINDSFGNDVAAIPFQFLEQASLTCAYLTYVAEAAVNESGDLLLGEVQCSANDIIQKKVYVWRTNQPRTFRLGPQGKSRAAPYRLHNLDGDDSTYSRSSRSSAVQNAFRFQAIARDGLCLVTSSADVEALQGCHIAPKSRGDELVQAICGGSLGRRTDSVQNSLSLRADVHHHFDKYQFGVYTNEGTYSIHVFTSDDLLQYHNKPLRLRDEPEFRRRFPDKRILEWHYRQCVLARLRRD